MLSNAWIMYNIGWMSEMLQGVHITRSTNTAKYLVRFYAFSPQKKLACIFAGSEVI
jgi:hypothetical protein